MARRTCISIISLDVNRLNAPTERHRLAEWIQKQDLPVCCLQGTHFRSRDKYKVRGREKGLHANGNRKKAGAAILVSDKTDYKRQGRSLHNDGGINSRRRNSCNSTQHRSSSTHKANTNSHKEELDSDTVRVRGFSGQTPRQKINRETQALNDTLDQMDRTGVYRTLHPESRTPSLLNCTSYILQHRVTS